MISQYETVFDVSQPGYKISAAAFGLIFVGIATLGVVKPHLFEKKLPNGRVAKPSKALQWTNLLIALAIETCIVVTTIRDHQRAVLSNPKGNSGVVEEPEAPSRSGQELRAAVDQWWVNYQKSGKGEFEIEINNVVKPYLRLGCTMEQAREILAAAGMFVTTPKPNKELPYKVPPGILRATYDIQKSMLVKVSLSIIAYPVDPHSPTPVVGKFTAIVNRTSL